MDGLDWPQSWSGHSGDRQTNTVTAGNLTVVNHPKASHFTDSANVLAH
jgi:hypothetical protein